jgi:outer membrane protein assembly factor BamD
MFIVRHHTLLLVSLMLLLAACRTTPQVPKDMGTDEQAFNKAMELYRSKNYYDAKPAFTELRDRYPLSPYAVIAELRLADIHYFKEEYVEAIHFYEEFKRLHPSNPDVPYAIYQLGMCHFSQLETFDRDQTPAEKASTFFEYLIKNYPASPFTGSAMGHYKICRQSMFEHDYAIGRYYYKNKNYWASKQRFRDVLSYYTFIKNRDEVLYYLGLSYYHLDEPANAREVLSSLQQDHPGSPYEAEMQALLAAAPEGDAAAAPEAAVKKE